MEAPAISFYGPLILTHAFFSPKYSLPHCFFLFLSLKRALSLSLSLNIPHGPSLNTKLWASISCTLFTKTTRGRRLVGTTVSSPSKCRQRPWKVVREMAEEKWLRFAVTGHTHCQIKVPASCIRSHGRNGTFRSWQKWSDCQTRFSRQTIKTLTVTLCQTRSYLQVTISNF